jgi:hypothetical protein
MGVRSAGVLIQLGTVCLSMVQLINKEMDCSLCGSMNQHIKADQHQGEGSLTMQMGESRHQRVDPPPFWFVLLFI